MRSSFILIRKFTIHHSRFTIPLLCVLGCGVGEHQRPVAPPPPQIGIDETRKHDFGEIQQETPIEHTFNVSNRGGVDLTIDRMRTGCGCEASLEVERVVQPGATARLHVKCETRTAFGKQRKTVTLYTNDPVTPVTFIRLTGTVRARTTLTPATFYVGRVHRGERVRRDGSVRWSASDAPVDIVPNGNVPFRVEVSPAATGDRATFGLVINDDAPLGPIDARLLVRNAALQTLRSVAVVGEIVPDVSVSPARPALKAGLSAQTTAVMVQNEGARVVRVTGAEWALGTTTVDAIDAGKRYRITLTPQQPVTGESEMILRTDHPEQPMVRVPVVVSAQ